MNAVLKPITVMPLQRPTYVKSELLGHEREWIEANKALLRSWWNQLAGQSEEPLLDSDFDAFCGAQHDMQLTLRDAYRDAYRGP